METHNNIFNYKLDLRDYFRRKKFRKNHVMSIKQTLKIN